MDGAWVNSALRACVRGGCVCAVIVNSMLDVQGDWLRDIAGLLRHGRCVAVLGSRARILGVCWACRETGCATSRDCCAMAGARL
jgi:hypothetical protein